MQKHEKSILYTIYFILFSFFIYVAFVASQGLLLFFEQSLFFYYQPTIIVLVLLFFCFKLGKLACKLPKPKCEFLAYAPMFITLSLILLYFAFFGYPVIGSARYLLTAIVRTFFMLIGPILFILLFKKVNKSFEYKKSKYLFVFYTLLSISSIIYCVSSFVRYETRFKNFKYQNDGIYFGDYVPFVRNNKLPKLDFKASLSISSNYPKLDGATAFFPVYSTIAQNIYKGMSASKVDKYIFFSKTTQAYENLFEGKSDIIFVLEPSKEQEQMAKEKGIQLVLTPIGKEAFIFFTNSENKVSDLTPKQLVEIYTNKIKDWSELQGDKKEIYAMTRPKNSGSQTIMENIVMNGQDIIGAKIYDTMFAILEAAVYKNDKLSHEGAIGYTFRFFAKDMSGYDDYKIMKINGIEPTQENIANGSYPYIVKFYAITTTENLKKENVRKMLEWIKGEQGQSLIKHSGYNPLK